MEMLTIDGLTFRGDTIPLPTSAILVIQGATGILGCGYVSVETANKLGHPLAIVTGVATYDDMLNAKVVRMSDAAKELGVTTALTGKEALLLMNKEA